MEVYIYETQMDLSDANVTLVNMLGEEMLVPAITNATGASSLVEGTYMLIVRKDNIVLKRKITLKKY